MTPGKQAKSPLKQRQDISREMTSQTLGFQSTQQTPDMTPVPKDAAKSLGLKKGSIRTPAKQTTNSVFESEKNKQLVPNRKISHTVEKKSRIVDTSSFKEKIGIVNYINGVPVSI
jgi:hypothetical protein